jgi:mRNA interferase RelE/StbE
VDRFQVEVKRSAAKFLESQDGKTQLRIKQKIEDIAADPFDPHCSKWLAGHEGLRSARVGPNRIIFSVDRAARLLTILVIDSRGQVYDRL